MQSDAGHTEEIAPRVRSMQVACQPSVIVGLPGRGRARINDRQGDLMLLINAGVPPIRSEDGWVTIDVVADHTRCSMSKVSGIKAAHAAKPSLDKRPIMDI